MLLGSVPHMCSIWKFRAFCRLHYLLRGMLHLPAQALPTKLLIFFSIFPSAEEVLFLFLDLLHANRIIANIYIQPPSKPLLPAPLFFSLNKNLFFIIFSKQMFRSSRDVNDEIKEEFLPRPDKYKDLINNKQIPTTNQSLVVVPCLTKTYGFKTNQYKVNQKYLRGVILEKDFNGFVRKANKVIERELINKSNQQNEPFYKLISLLLKISIALAGIALILMTIIVYASIQGDFADIIFQGSAFLLCGSGLIACLCPIVIYRSQYASLNYQLIISDKLREIQAQENKANYSRRINHITWRIQKNFYWLELHIDRIMTEGLKVNDLT